MDFIKQNQVIVACLAAMVLFLIPGVIINVMRAGDNESKQAEYDGKVDKVEQYAGIAIDAFGLVQWRDEEHPYVMVSRERRKAIMGSLGQLSLAMKRAKNDGDVTVAVRAWVNKVHAEVPGGNASAFRDAVTAKLTVALTGTMRRKGITGVEAVRELQKKIAMETSMLVEWQVPDPAGGDPENLRLHIGYERDLVRLMRGKKSDLIKMRDLVIKAQIDRGRLGQKQTLVPGVFPNSEQSVIQKFQDKYRQRVENLAKGLLSGQPYTAQELTKKIGGGGPKNVKTDLRDFEIGDIFQGVMRPGGRPARVPYARTPGGASAPGGVSAATAKVMTAQEKLQLQRARSPELQIYLVYPYKTFGVPQWAMPGVPVSPTLERAWYGQVKLWIIEDFVAALGDTNMDTPAARNVAEGAHKITGNRFSVEQSIVKHLKGIRIGPTPGGVMSALGGGSKNSGSSSTMGTQPENPYARMASAKSTKSTARTSGKVVNTFTRRKPCKFYDVTYVGIRVVIDSRHIRRFMKHIDGKRFYTAVSLRAKEVDHEAARAAGFWYGKQPMVDLILVYEALLFREVYLNQTGDTEKVGWVPENVKALLGGFKLPIKPGK